MKLKHAFFILQEGDRFEFWNSTSIEKRKDGKIYYTGSDELFGMIELLNHAGTEGEIIKTILHSGEFKKWISKINPVEESKYCDEFAWEDMEACWNASEENIHSVYNGLVQAVRNHLNYQHDNSRPLNPDFEIELSKIELHKKSFFEKSKS